MDAFNDKLQLARSTHAQNATPPAVISPSHNHINSLLVTAFGVHYCDDLLVKKEFLCLSCVSPRFIASLAMPRR